MNDLVDNINKILSNNDIREPKSNKLAPSIHQTKQLKQIDNIKIIQKYTLQKTFELLTLISKTLESSYRIGIKRRQSYENRAKIIYDTMQQNNMTNLKMMDGHGRMVYYVLKEFAKHNNLDKLHIELYDIDDTVNVWHQLLFPQKYIKAIHGNILDCHPDERTCVYLNFCGIENQESKIKDFLNIYYHQCIISFSTRSNNPNGSIIKQNKITPENLNLVQVDNSRADFLTFSLKENINCT